MHPGAIGPGLAGASLSAAWEQGLGDTWMAKHSEPPSSGPHQGGWATNEPEAVRTCPSSPRLSDWLISIRDSPRIYRKTTSMPDGKKFHSGKNTKEAPAANNAFCLKDSQRQGPHTPSPRFTCAFQGVWEPRSNVHPQLVPDFSNRSLISKGQGQAHTSNRRAREARSGPQRPWGGHSPGTEVVEGSCGVRRHAGSVHSFLCRLSFVTLLLRQAGKGVILSVTIWLCARTAAQGRTLFLFGFRFPLAVQGTALRACGL